MAAALALVSALVLAATPPVGGHGRLTLGAAADGGWASDAWVGAGRGPGALVRVAPEARLDLSAAPRLKLGATADASFTRFAGADFGATTAAGALEARVPLDVVELSARGGGDGAWYSDAAPAGDLAGAPAIRRAAGVDLSLGARTRRGTVRGRAATAGFLRASRLDATADAPAGRAGERGLSLAAGLTWSPAPGVDLDADVRHERVASATAGFGRTSTGGVLAVRADALPGGLQARLAGGAEAVRFDGGPDDLVWRAGADLSRPLGPLAVVAGWSFTASDAGGRSMARRQVAFLGLRARKEALAW